jgi:hypothetical protein
MRHVRSLGAIAALGGLMAFYPIASASADSKPVGTVSADKAKTVDLGSAPTVHGPPLPDNAFINRPTLPLDKYKAAKAGHSSGKRPGPAAPPGPQVATNLLGFDGITQATAQSTWPPDINGSASSTQVAEVVNQHLTVFDRSGNQTSDRSLATVTGYGAQAIFDPRLVYDSTWNRWVAIAEAFPESASSQRLFIMVSTTGNAGGSYFVYNLNAVDQCGSGNFYDYPQLGINQDAIVITANCFAGNTYLGARVIGVAKAQIYNGLGFTVPIFAPSSGDSTTTPSIVYDQNPNMDMLTRNGPDVIRFRNPANAFYSTGLTDNTISGFVTPTIPRDAGQAGCTVTSCLLDTSDGRFAAPGVEYGVHLWNVASYGFGGVSGSFATPTFGEFNPNAHTTIQAGVVFADGCSDDFNPSITANSVNGKAWLNWTSTNPDGSSCGGTFVRQYVATRLPTDAAGTFPSVINPFTSSFELTNNFDLNFGTQRWGDTSSTSLDPANNTAAWTWNESVASTNGTQGGNEWGTRAHRVRNTG